MLRDYGYGSILLMYHNLSDCFGLVASREVVNDTLNLF